VPLPDAQGRTAFLSAMLARPEIDSSLTEDELGSLALATEGFSGSDMTCLCRHASMAPVRELLACARQEAAASAGSNSSGRAKRRRVAWHEPGGAGGGQGAAMLRALVAADFRAALEKIRPAALDATNGGAAATAATGNGGTAKGAGEGASEA
jgi:SpoVK/Ycf46/Vps4 family AAA+-type ATPase